MFAIVAKLLRFAILLGVAGSLVDTTLALMKEAGHAHETGLISLYQLNQSLLNAPGKRHYVHPQKITH